MIISLEFFFFGSDVNTLRGFPVVPQCDLRIQYRYCLFNNFGLLPARFRNIRKNVYYFPPGLFCYKRPVIFTYFLTSIYPFFHDCGKKVEVFFH